MAKRVTVRKSPSLTKETISQNPRKVSLSNLRQVNFGALKSVSFNQILIVLLILAAFLIGVLLTKVQYLEKGQTANQAAAPAAQQAAQPAGLQDGQKVDVDTGTLPLLGNKDAKVTVIEFADFQCPFCEQWFQETGTNLIKDYVDTGKVKFAFRNFAFLGDESNWAAEAAYCANDQNKFWDYHDYLYNHQGAENSGAFSKDNLKGFAATLGLNTADFNSCLDSGKYTKAVTDDTTAGNTAGVSGTPTVFVNGAALVGAQPYATLKTLIDQELSK